MGTIEIRSISRVFAKNHAVNDVSLTVEDGDFLVLLGPSGCGKTTLLRMLAGLLEPTSGQIILDGADITREPSKKRDLAMVFQSYALYPHLTVASNLGFPLRVKGTPRAEVATRVEEVARMLEIDHLLARRPKELSGGQRQRVAVGRALVRNPRAFLMDEPLSNLDAKLRTATRQELTALHRRLGATFVYVTHDQVEAMTMATRIAVLNNGHLEQVGTPADVYDRPATAFVAGFLGSPAMNLLDARVDTVDGTVVVEADGIGGALWDGDTDPTDVTLGIRPEHLRIDDRITETRGVHANATVVTVENLGSEEIIYCTLGARQVAVRMTRTDTIVVGQSVTLSASLAHVHLFDRLTGVRLEWVDAATGPSELTAPVEFSAV
ncbi:MAG: putative transporter ATP-binding protein [Glaciihabitans sp.]|nr:putative transporter ATP-binding protein [Glaciihabitans sp.]